LDYTILKIGLKSMDILNKNVENGLH